MKLTGRLQFCLFVERYYAGARGGAQRAKPEVIQLDGPTSLRLCDNLIATSNGLSESALVFEPLFNDHTPSVALTVRDRHAVVYVNGVRIGPVHVLRVGDVVECDGEALALHLSMLRRPYLGPPRSEHVGRECAVCLTPIAEPATAPPDGAPDTGTLSIFECVACGAVLHERVTLPGSTTEVLECSRTVAVCPCCDAPLVREEGYAYVPEI